MATIFCYKRNNYYNRRLKRIFPASDQWDYMHTATELNFNPADGVDTSFTIGNELNPYFGNCDYLVYSEDNTSVTSRWFIVDQPRNRRGQYRARLHRDLIADFEQEICDSPAFIEKAILPTSSPLIFNREGIAVNQIKKSETLLKDSTGCAWLVAYLKRDYTGGEITDIIAAATADYTSIPYSRNVDYNKRDYGLYKILGYEPLGYGTGTTYREILICYDESSDTWYYERGSISPYPSDALLFINDEAIEKLLYKFRSGFDPVRFTVHDGESGKTFSASDYEGLATYSGKTLSQVVSGSTKYYKINVTDRAASVAFYPDAKADVNSFISAARVPGVTGSVRLIRGTIFYSARYWQGSEIQLGTYSVNMPAFASRDHLRDAPYDMFCIPFDDVTVTNTAAPSGAGWVNVTLSKSLAMTIAQGIASKLAPGSGWLIDLQLLPFCPIDGIRSTVTAEGEHVLDVRLPDSKSYTFITTSGNTKKAVILWSKSSSGSFDINMNIDVENPKIDNETKTFRLVSPNFNGIYEFSVAKNRGLSGFNVDYNYLPFSPYIHVNPQYNEFGLYGKDFNSPVGLVCGGDFSISMTSDNWEAYKIQNKNFEAIFDRELQSMDTMQSIARRQARWGIATGAIGGGSAGAFAGSQIAGPWGAAIGAGVGAAASLAGGAADYAILKQQQAEQKSYKMDIHAFALDNVQALPNSLTKVTAYNENNKIFPIFEEYSCTDEERRIVANNIAWNSMTVGAVGTIADYRGNSWSFDGIDDRGFIRAQLLRIEGIDDDTHLFEAINAEIMKGWYFK